MSKVMSPVLAWLLLSLFLLAVVWLQQREQGGKAAIGTIVALILPILGLLVTYSGLTLSAAALLSVLWLALHQRLGERAAA